MTEPRAFDAGIARQIGHYADAVRVPAGYDQIPVPGTPGLDIPAYAAVRSKFITRQPGSLT
ncbi:MAG: hypothetical protein ACRDRJ_40055 [Streptosporangiaceae bacterium]